MRLQQQKASEQARIAMAKREQAVASKTIAGWTKKAWSTAIESVGPSVLLYLLLFLLLALFVFLRARMIVRMVEDLKVELGEA